MQYLASSACHDNVARTIEIREHDLLPSPVPLMEYELVYSVRVLSRYTKNCSTITVLFKLLGLAMYKEHYADLSILLFLCQYIIRLCHLLTKGK